MEFPAGFLSPLLAKEHLAVNQKGVVLAIHRPMATVASLSPVYPQRSGYFPVLHIRCPGGVKCRPKSWEQPSWVKVRRLSFLSFLGLNAFPPLHLLGLYLSLFPLLPLNIFATATHWSSCATYKIPPSAAHHSTLLGAGTRHLLQLNHATSTSSPPP